VFNDGSSLVADITMQTMFDYNTSALDLDEAVPGDIAFITSEPGSISHGGMVTRVRDQWIAGFGRMQRSTIR
jgi:hypothetical protein